MFFLNLFAILSFQDRSTRSKSGRRSDKRRGSSGGASNQSDHPPDDELDTGGGGGLMPEIRSARVAKSPLLSERSSLLGAAAPHEGHDSQAASSRSWHDSRRSSPDKVSRDSGVPSPSDDAVSVTTENSEQAVAMTAGAPLDTEGVPVSSTNGFTATVTTQPQSEVMPTSAGGGLTARAEAYPPNGRLSSAEDPAVVGRFPMQPSRLNNGGLLPVKAELVTNELEPGLSGG